MSLKTERVQRIEAATIAERERMSAARKPRKTYKSTVHNPYGHGIDRVDRLPDPFELLLKRKQISEREYDAGHRIQIAHETVYGQAGGAMDFERARGGGLHGQPPALPYMVASETLADAKKRLYPRDHAVVQFVCIHGHRIESCAHLFGEGRAAKEEAGRALRRALSELADMWWPETARRPKPSVYRSEKVSAGDVEIVVPSAVYHAG